MVSICTQVKDRNSFLLQTIPTWLDFPCDEIVIFDWPGNEKAVDIYKVFSDQRIKIFTNTESDFYIYGQSTAKNSAIRCCSGDIIFYIDADTKITNKSIPMPRCKEFTQGRVLLKEHINKKGFEEIFVYGGIDERIFACETSGAFIVKKENWVAINGFDERMVGWGFDDEDFYIRLIESGLSRKTFLDEDLMHIDHDDNLRVSGYAIKNKMDSWNTNRILTQINKWSCKDIQQRYLMSLCHKNNMILEI